MSSIAKYLAAVHPVNQAQKRPVVETSHLDSSGSSSDSSDSEPLSPTEHRSGRARKQSTPQRKQTQNLSSDELLCAKGITKDAGTSKTKKYGKRRKLKTKVDREINHAQKHSHESFAIPRACFQRLVKQIFQDPDVNRTTGVTRMDRAALEALQDVAEAHLVDRLCKARWIAGNVGKRVTIMRQDLQAVRMASGDSELTRDKRGRVLFL
jgi:histone H3/H4